MANKSIQRTKEIKYSWWRDDGKEISRPLIIDILHGRAEEHISKMMLGGYSSGELWENLNEVIYRGSWEVTIKD